MTSRLASLLVQDGLVSAKKMAEAFQRQVIYGGTLDTILLEMNVIDEPVLLDALGRASGLPTMSELPSNEVLRGRDAKQWMAYPLVERFRAVPLLLEGNVLQVLVLDPADRKQLGELGYLLSLSIAPVIVPEHRFMRAVELLYGTTMPARLASLAVKLRQRALDPNRLRVVPAGPSAAGSSSPQGTLDRAAAREAVENVPRPVDRLLEAQPPRHSQSAPESLVGNESGEIPKLEPATTAPTLAKPAAATPRAGTAAAPRSEAHSAAPPAEAPTTAPPAEALAAPPAEAPVATPPAQPSAATPPAQPSAATPPAQPSAATPPAQPSAATPRGESSAAITALPATAALPSGDVGAPGVASSEEAPSSASSSRAAAPLGEIAAPSSAPPAGPSLAAPPTTPLAAAAAQRAIDEAAGRDDIFEALCRGARARLPFAAILTVHGDLVAGRVALGQTWFDKHALSGVAVPLEPPSPFRSAVVGRAPYLGRMGDDERTLPVLAGMGRKPPLPGLLIPIILRDRTVALLYGDGDGAEIAPRAVAELTLLAAAAARSFQRLIVRAKGGDGGAEPPVAPGGVTAPSRSGRFDAALINALKDLAATNTTSDPDSEAAAVASLDDATTSGVPDLGELLASVAREDASSTRAAEMLLALGEPAARALVATLPGPSRGDRHASRSLPLEQQGPLLALLARMGSVARAPLLERLGDPSLEVRYYATMALGRLRHADDIASLGTRLYDPDVDVRRAAVEALAHFPESPQRLTLIEQLRGDLPGPDGVRQRYAVESLGTLRDIASVPRLIALVKHSDGGVATAARKALVEITKQDFGTSRWRWRSWWERHRSQPRVEWMLEGLSHAEPEVRLSASEELRRMGSEYFGYAFDLPKREREDARKKWIAWWRAQGAKQAR